MTNSFLNKLTPKEPKFFPLLKQLSKVISTASELLIDCLQSESREEIAKYYKKIKEQEHEGDRLSQIIFDELNSTFITPFDREDIHMLANTLDDVADGINSCAKRIMLYNPKQIPQNAIQIALLVKEAAASIEMAVEELDVLKKNPVNVKKYCRNLHDIEKQADDVYEKFIIQLFDEEKDSIEIIKLKEIVHELERITDVEEHVGKIIRTIIVKYA